MVTRRNDVTQRMYEALVLVRPPLPAEHVKAALATYDVIRKVSR